MNKVLILGAAGFIGRHLQSFVSNNNIDKDFEFIGVDRAGANDNDYDFTMPIIEKNLLDCREIEDIVGYYRPELIINLVGTFSTNDYDVALAVNAGVTWHLCESISKLRIAVERILLIGSAAEYGSTSSLPVDEEAALNPVNTYGLTKTVQTKYAEYYERNFGLNISVARPFNIVGNDLPKTLSMGNFAEQIKTASNGETITVGNLQSKRDFLDVEDVVDALWRILLRGKSGGIYNVCSGKSHSIQELLEAMIKASGKRLEVKVTEQLVKRFDIDDSYGDNSKLAKDTGWRQQKDIFKTLSDMIV